MQLIRPDKKYYQSYVEAIEEYHVNNVRIRPFLDYEIHEYF